MRPVPLVLDQAHTNALKTRDLRCVNAAMRPQAQPWQAAGFDITLEHSSGQGAAVTGSGPTLHDALRRTIDAFDTYVRPSLRKDTPHGPPEPHRDQSRTRARTRTRVQRLSAT